ncbi:hypothetical protein TorRG33x02_298650, partial [Trema orientale]
ELGKVFMLTREEEPLEGSCSSWFLGTLARKGPKDLQRKRMYVNGMGQGQILGSHLVV